MISDDELYALAIFLGSAAMLMIVLYHFLEANSVEDVDAKTGVPVAEATSGSKAKTKASSTICAKKSSGSCVGLEAFLGRVTTALRHIAGDYRASVYKV
ncbi:hypothetical protein VE03_05507 [Pseudogymnoascus sp. 23342-1-I1]|nr:hypothetical protein VE03_05507 [Pseudogymnoascus sp. 23342-1-I1]